MTSDTGIRICDPHIETPCYWQPNHYQSTCDEAANCVNIYNQLGILNKLNYFQ